MKRVSCLRFIFNLCLGVIFTVSSLHAATLELKQTSRPFDLAITGPGFLVVNSSAGEELYTRAGSLVTNGLSGLITTRDGFLLQAYPVDRFGNVSDSLSNVNLATLSTLPIATSEIRLNFNLDPNEESLSADFDASTRLSAQETSHFSVPCSGFDKFGETLDLVFYVGKRKSGEWDFHLVNYPGANELGVVLKKGVLLFDGQGDLESINISPAYLKSSIQLDFGSGSSASSKPTQKSGPLILKRLEQNGRGIGALRWYKINRLGRIIAFFSNGETREVYRIPLAQFKNPSSLKFVENSKYVQAKTNESGSATINYLRNSEEGWILSYTLINGLFDYPELPDFSQQAINAANRSTDLAIQGKGFFIVEDMLTGEKYYTRSGSFYQSPYGQLVNSRGEVRPLAFKLENGVLGSVLGPVDIDANHLADEIVEIEILRDGTVQAVLTDSKKIDLYLIPLANFLNAEGLESIVFDRRIFRSTQSSGDPVIGTPGSSLFGELHSYALELLD